jgi:hypothetical protein
MHRWVGFGVIADNLRNIATFASPARARPPAPRAGAGLRSGASASHHAAEIVEQEVERDHYRVSFSGFTTSGSAQLLPLGQAVAPDLYPCADCSVTDHSDRSTNTGSVRDARRAGIAVAINVIAATTIVAVARTTGSVARMP